MIEIKRSLRWYRYLDVVLIIGVLLAMGVVKFSHVSVDQRSEIELESRLEQVYEFEMDYYAKHKRYYDPRSAQYKSYLGRLGDCDCDVRLGREEFAVIARADFDGDGQAGVWRIDQTSPTARQVVED